MVEYAIVVGMYLRTTQRKNRDGTTVTYYQLAHNIRRAETKTPVAEVIHNFGRADQLDREELVRLCKSIARICGVVIHDPFTFLQEGKETGLPKDVRYVQTMELGSVVVNVIDLRHNQLKNKVKIWYSCA